MSGNRLPAACAALSAAGLALGLAGRSLLFGWCAVVLIALLAALGCGARASRRTIAAVSCFGAVFCLLLFLSHALHDPGGPLVPFAGFPPGTAVLVYGVGPLGLSLGLLYAFTFDKEILPEERRKAFLDRFGPRK